MAATSSGYSKRRRALPARLRRLLLEQLEGRRLLTTAVLGHEFRDETFSISGSFSYSLIDGNVYRDSIQNGQYESTDGTITWESPRLGKGSFTGIATGDGDDFVRAGGAMRACSSYGIDDRGQIDFDVDALNETLLITENRLDSTIYTYYIDHTKGNCPAPVPPWSRFFGGKSNLYVGTFDAANSTASISYDESNPDISINTPPAPVEWEHNEPTALKLTAKAPPPEFELPEGWVVVDQTTEPPKDIEFIHLESGIEIQVEVQGRPLPIRGNVEQVAAEIKLYWQDTPLGLQRVEIPVEVVGNEAFGLYWNTQMFNATVKDFPEPPTWANFIKIEVDRIGAEFAEDNSKILGIDRWKASNNVTDVELSEDSAINGLLGSIMHIRDSMDRHVKLYAYKPESALGASVSVRNDEGGFFYDPTESPEIQALREGEEVNDAMEFVAVKYQSIFSFAAHVVLLVGANDLPVVNNEEGETLANQPLFFQPAANDHDIDRDDFVVLHSVPQSSQLGARLTKSDDGSVHYDPSTSKSLTDLYIEQTLVDTFDYEVIDTFGGKSTGTVTITVTGVRPYPATVLVLPTTQFTTRNNTTEPIPFQVSHTSFDPALLTVSVRSLRPDVVADDKLLISGSGNDRTVQAIPTAGQVGRVPVELTVTAPDGDSAQGVFQLFVGTDVDQDLDGVSNDDEDRGPNAGDANGDGILDRLQANISSMATNAADSRMLVSLPEGAYLTAVSLASAPAPSGVAAGANFPLGLLSFSVELPPGEGSTEMLVSTDYASEPLNAAYFHLTATSGSEWLHLMRNGQEGVRVFSDRMVVRLLDGGATDNGTAGDGHVTHTFALASVENPWQNLLALDVNNNGTIQPIDALIIINDLNRNKIRDLPSRLAGEDQIPNFFDVSGDSKITPIDALIIINWLNRQPNGRGSGEWANLPEPPVAPASYPREWGRPKTNLGDGSEEDWRLHFELWDQALEDL